MLEETPLLDEALFEKALAVDQLKSSRGWMIVQEILEEFRKQAQDNLHGAVLADAQVIKGYAQKWAAIEGFINELHIRLDGIQRARDENLAELEPEQVTDPEVQQAIHSLSLGEEDPYY